MRVRSMRKFGSLSSRPSVSMRCARVRTARDDSKERAAELSGDWEFTADISIFLKVATDRVDQVLRRHWIRCEVAGSLLGGDLHMRVGRDHVVGDRHAFDD